MMKTSYLVLAALLWATPVSGPVVSVQDKPNPLAGQWRPVGGEFAGEALPPKDISTTILTFEPDGRYRDADGSEGTWVADVSTSPKRVELAHTAGRYKGHKQLGIFEVAGERLTLVLAIPGGTNRPTELKTSKQNTNVVLLVFERVKGLSATINRALR